uniref:Uncharacterized protein n=1 Tax=Anguilla anguilla TaxID=7936 RepID=A0A0E9SFF0_ANGAN
MVQYVNVRDGKRQAGDCVKKPPQTIPLFPLCTQESKKNLKSKKDNWNRTAITTMTLLALFLQAYHTTLSTAAQLAADSQLACIT